MSQAEFKKRLQALMNKPENQVCSDCPERQPRWASLIVPPPGSPPGALPIGAFCCLECSGSHRRLGVHISFVRSINLDSWKEKEVLAMERGGNKKVNAIFEANLNTAKPTTLADGRTRERFIRDKYERRKFFNPAVVQSIYNGEESDSSDDDSSDDDKRARRQAKPAARAPSDAAKKRAESRKLKVLSPPSQNVSSSSSKPQKPEVKKSAPQPPVQTEVADLLDFSADFSTPMSNPGPPPDPPSLTPSPNLDLFKQMSINGSKTESNSDTISDNAAQSASRANVAERKKYNNDEILSLFNQPQQHMSAQMGYGMNNNVMQMGNGNMNMNMNMNMMQMNQNMMALNNNMMGTSNMMGMMPQQAPNMNMNMNPNMNMNMSTYNTQQQQSQQRSMMMMQNNGTMQQQNQYYNGMNQGSTNSGGMGNMQQHLAMMNNMQISNSGMMMQGNVSNGSSSKEQQYSSYGVMGGTGNNENPGMHRYGM